MNDSKAAVPKFSSFKPKKVPDSKSDVAGHDCQDRRRKPSGRKHERDRRERHERPRQNDGRHGRHRQLRSRSPEGYLLAHPDSTGLPVPDQEVSQIQEELAQDGVKIFVFDRRGDPDNLRYGGLHRYSVPEYRRYGNGRVIGLPPDLRIDKDASDGKTIVLNKPQSKPDRPRALMQKSWLKNTQSLRLVKYISEPASEAPSKEYIPLSSGRKRKRRSESPIAEDGETDFRSVEGKAIAPLRPVDADVTYDSASEADGTDSDVNSPARLRNVELARRTRDQPQDVQGWEELLNHQEKLLSLSRGLTATQSRVLADIRIVIYEQALSAVEDVEAKISLTLGLLGEGATIWEASQLEDRWNNALHTFSNNERIWTAYLDYLQTKSNSFRYEMVKGKYIACLAILSKELRESRRFARSAELANILIYVFLRLTCFMRDAGYHELAEALWQALLELHFFRPSGISIEDEAVAEGFEDFWESEMPRIGEDGATGWNNYDSTQATDMSPVAIDIDHVNSSENLFQRFARAEQNAMTVLAHAGRSEDIGAGNDPYHLVMFTDLKLVLFPHMVRIEEKRHILSAFLRFRGLPALAWSNSWGREKWWNDPLCAMSSASLLIPKTQSTSDTLFSNMFSSLDIYDWVWLRRALKNLVAACPDDDALAEYAIAAEYSQDPKSASKATKNILRTRPACLRLYNCFAIIEHRNKGPEAGTRIFATAIQMSSNLHYKDSKFAVLLWRSWAWEYLRSGSIKAASNIILSLGATEDLAVSASKDQDFSPAATLRVTRWLKDGRDAFLNEEDPHLGVLHSELLALFTYLLNNNSIEAGLATYSDSEALLTARRLKNSPAHEHLLQSKAQLISHHTKHTRLYKPSLLRAALEECLNLFPHNTLLLTTHAALGSNLSVLVRNPSNILDDVILAPKRETVASWTFALSSALGKVANTGGAVHGVRALFERAVAGVGRHNTHIWRHYLTFELEFAELRNPKEVRRVRDVFLRGLREVPWWKGWIVMGLEALSEVVGFEEARGWWEVLGERELRVIVDIEEVVEEVGNSEMRKRMIERRAE